MIVPTEKFNPQGLQKSTFDYYINEAEKLITSGSSSDLKTAEIILTMLNDYITHDHEFLCLKCKNAIDYPDSLQCKFNLTNDFRCPKFEDFSTIPAMITP